jgi:hypothetical protein
VADINAERADTDAGAADRHSGSTDAVSHRM